jgi:hypothetical protein
MPLRDTEVECTYEVDGTSVVATPVSDLPFDATVTVLLTTDIRGTENERLASNYRFTFQTVPEGGQWVLWWGCDNDSTSPVIRVSDYNPYNFILSFDGSPTDYIETNKQVVGNGCVYNPSSGHNITLSGDPISFNKVRMGMYIMFPSPSVSGGQFLINGTTYSIKIYIMGTTLYVEYIDSATTLQRTMANAQFNTWYFIETVLEFNTGPPYSTLTVYVDGESLGSSTNSIGFPTTISSLKWAWTGWTPAYLDQLIITKDITKDLYPLRGFDVYTPDLPPIPTLPTDNIVFWLTGDKNEYNLPAVRYWPNADSTGGEDWTLGSWANYLETYPKQFVSDSTMVPETTGSMKFTNNVQWTSIYFDDALEALTDYNLGFWFEIITNSNMNQFVALGEGNFGSGTYNGVWIYRNAGVSNLGFRMGGTDQGKISGVSNNTPHFIQFKIDSTNSSYSYKLDNNSWTEVTGQTTSVNPRRFIITSDNGYTGTEILISNVIISTDLNLDMYNTRHGGIRLCELTKYPTTDPDNMFIFIRGDSIVVPPPPKIGTVIFIRGDSEE